MIKELTPIAHHLIKAYREWLMENFPIVHIRVDVSKLEDPSLIEKSNEGILTLSVGEAATPDFSLSPDIVEFTVRFSGRAQIVTIPTIAIDSIYGATHDGTRTQAFHIPHIGTSTNSSNNKKSATKPTLQIVK